MSKKQSSSTQQLSYYATHHIWNSFPSTVKWLQVERDKERSTKEKPSFQNPRRGINATIILLSAACVEGFLVECLNTYLIGTKFLLKETIEQRMYHYFLKKLQDSSFSNLNDLFIVMLGKTLEQLAPTQNNGILKLMSFRNGVAHARSFIYETYLLNPENTISSKSGEQYQSVHQYLKEKRLIDDEDDIFNNHIADHFAGLVKPYIDTIVTYIPENQSSNIKTLVNIGFRDQ